MRNVFQNGRAEHNVKGFFGKGDMLTVVDFYVPYSYMPVIVVDVISDDIYPLDLMAIRSLLLRLPSGTWPYLQHAGSCRNVPGNSIEFLNPYFPQELKVHF